MSLQSIAKLTKISTAISWTCSKLTLIFLLSWISYLFLFNHAVHTFIHHLFPIIVIILVYTGARFQAKCLPFLLHYNIYLFLGCQHLYNVRSDSVCVKTKKPIFHVWLSLQRVCAIYIFLYLNEHVLITSKQTVVSTIQIQLHLFSISGDGENSSMLYCSC